MMNTHKADTGLRVKANGSIRIKPSVFFARTEVKELVTKMRASQAYPNQNK